MSEADKAEWIEERAAIIFYDWGSESGRSFYTAKEIAVQCWQTTYGDPQLF